LREIGLEKWEEREIGGEKWDEKDRMKEIGREVGE
jgi:hypothetical protein